MQFRAAIGLKHTFSCVMSKTYRCEDISTCTRRLLPRLPKSRFRRILDPSNRTLRDTTDTRRPSDALRVAGPWASRAFVPTWHPLTFAPLQWLATLHRLSINTGRWSPNPSTVDSPSNIPSLPRVQHLRSATIY